MPRARRQPNSLKAKGKEKSPWAGIPEKNRPTPERLRHGAVCVITGKRVKLIPSIEPRPIKENGQGREVGKAGIVVNATPIDRLFAEKRITERQHIAAAAFEALSHACKEIGGGRDSLDFSPKGHSGYDPRREERLAADKRSYGVLRASLGYMDYLTLKSVTVEHHEVGRRLKSLTRALDAAADFFAVPGEENC